MLSSIGLTYPWMLILAPLCAAFLLYVYLKRGQGKRLIISSTLIFSQLKNTASARRRINLPWRLLVELLVFTLLAFAAAGVFRVGAGERVAILIDNSFSLNARPQLDKQKSLLDLSRESARKYLQSLPNDAEVAIYITSPRLIQLSKSWISPSSANLFIDQIEVAPAGANIESELAQLARKSELRRIYIVSDQSPALKELPKDDRIKFSTVGGEKQIENFSIGDIALEGNSLTPENVVLSANILSHAKTQKSLSIVASFLSTAGSSLSILSTQGLTIEPGNSKKISFKNLPDATLYKIELKENDGILLDNSAWIAPTTLKRRILFVTDSPDNNLGLEKIGLLDFKIINSQAYSPKLIEDGTPIIFDSNSPAELPPSNSLFINPPDNNAFYSSRNVSRNSQVTDWVEAHPILTYLNLAALKMQALKPLGVPSWANSLINTSDGPAVVAGEFNRHRYAAVGFQIFPYEGGENRLVSILSLNLLKWLVDSSLNNGYLPPYSTLKLEPTTSSVHSLDDKNFSREPIQKGQVTFSRPGAYALNDSTRPTRMVAVNFFSSQESNTLEPGKYNLSTLATKLEEPQSPHSWTKLLAEVVLIILILDLIISTLSTIRQRSTKWNLT